MIKRLKRNKRNLGLVLPPFYVVEGERCVERAETWDPLT